MENKRQKAIIYTRVSSKEQADEGYSLESQEKLLQEYSDKLGLDVAKTYKIAETASKDHVRKIFREVFEYASKQQINIILCEKIDRLTRSLKSAGVVDDWVREKPERSVHFVKEHFVLNQQTKAHDNFVWDMKVAVARFYTNNLSEEVRKGQKEKLEQGGLPYRAPLGYKTIGEKGHKIHVIDPEMAVYVKDMFELYSTGLYSVLKLANLMYEKGLRTPNGSKMYSNSLYRILKNPFYYGEINWNGKVYPNATHEKLIEKDLFDTVQRIMKNGRPDKYVKHNPLFKGLASCGQCGHKISWYEKKGHWYGRCAYYKACDQHKTPIREDRLVEQVFPFFEHLIINEADITRIKEQLQNDHISEIESRKTIQNDLKRKIERAKSKLDVIYNDRLDGRITHEYYDQKKIEIEEELKQLHKTWGQFDKNEIDYFDLGINLMELASKMKDLFPYATKQEKQEIFTLAFDQMKVSDRVLEIQYTPWFAKLRVHVPELKQICEPLQKPMDKRKNTNLVVDVHSWLGRQGSNLRPGD
jgi:site-specific DNA recombinase